MTLKTLTLTLALLAPSALNAMQASELDLGSEKSYKELHVTALLTQEPFGSMAKSYDSATVIRFYTQSNARLHHNLGREQASANTADCATNPGHCAAMVQFARCPLQKNSTVVVVNYKLEQNPWSPPSFPLTTIASEQVHLTIGGEKHTVEHRTSNQELITLAMVATWNEYKVAHDGRHEKVTPTDTTICYNKGHYDDDNE